jgi:endo-1,4-beta-D-glucanase Y
VTILGRTTLLLALAAAACLPRPSIATGGSGYLRDSWDAYKEQYLDDRGFVLDRTRGDGEVTSEGQSYALLRAAWLDDRATFARVLDWTEQTLARPDGLYSWRWSPRGGGRVLDANTATDADQDIAFALIVGAARFDEPRYVERAARIVRAIRLVTGVELAAGWFPSAGNWAVRERIVNLSYFTPYAYPHFARLDPNGRWMEVADVGYTLLSRSTGGARRLPPDFMTVGPAGEIGGLPESSTLSRRFSFDAARIPWRVELDCRLHQRPQACAANGGIPFLLELAAAPRPRIVNAYDTDGTARSQQESPSFYAAILPALERRQPQAAARIRRDQLSEAALTRLATRDDRYYDANWVWFGVALADGWIVPRTPTSAGR